MCGFAKSCGKSEMIGAKQPEAMLLIMQRYCFPSSSLEARRSLLPIFFSGIACDPNQNLNKPVEGPGPNIRAFFFLLAVDEVGPEVPVLTVVLVQPV